MLTATLFVSLLSGACALPGPADYFRIRVVDAETGRGVPLVELTTVNNVRHYTDSAGNVAFHEPGLLNRTVFFHVKGHGYQFPEDGFGYRGKRLKVVPGGEATVKIQRLNIAQRLYRVTGAGIYRDSVLLGDRPPVEKPVLNGLVFGSDSVVNAVYRGKIYWFWGDTNRPSYPLGNFHVPGATSLLPAGGGLDPEKGIDLDYFVGPDGFAKPTCRMPGKGPTWIDGLVVLKDPSGRERLFAKYVKVEGFLKIYERGLVEFNDETQQFEKRAQFDMSAPVFPRGHPFKHVVDGVEYVYFASPYPFIRARATPPALLDLGAYEVYTYLKRGSTAAAPEVDRDNEGRVRPGWKRDSFPLDRKLENRLMEEEKLEPQEGLFQIRDVETKKPVLLHGGSVYWNEYRRRWVMIALESLGSSALGEIWFSEAPEPTGPWLRARKIVTHEKYSFYNPKQHPMLDREGGRIIYFEGTYTSMFSGNPDRTPRYNYNQILYRLDLADPRLELPPVERERAGSS